MDAVELDVDVVDSILSWHEPDRVLVTVDVLDEAVVGLAGGRNQLKRVIYNDN